MSEYETPERWPRAETPCPKCGSSNTISVADCDMVAFWGYDKCLQCGHKWNEYSGSEQ